MPKKLFEIQTDKIENGTNLMRNSSKLTSWKGDLSSLTNGDYMFWACSELTSFTGNLSSLTSGSYMFYSCSELNSFAADSSGSPVNLGSLTSGSYMFQNCTKLTTFTSDLSSLWFGTFMFGNCKLNTESLIHIAETIRTVANKSTIHIGLGHTPTEEDTELLTEIHNKGWSVYVGVNGNSPSEFTPTSLIPIDGEETITPIPYWAKPQETDEEHAEYIGEDGKFYIILGGNYIFVDDPETYGLFTSLEDAAANMRLTKIEKTEIEKA